ncbi:nitroreductase/quinone reductase family protein [Mycobacterium europaeum]|uniref:Deazaflavin-dependent nitroreductase family protein n=1 Tax=Mycobacterium europaeum TaxID=761804 RepID=A0A0U1CYF4_9MYCO|nr:nitroreductase/quinone reductase family protein [Mycobacterium europaeum]MEA1161004.1 nitroreductase/quinone reductase family protein [Mycobacterium europaeum]ORV62133.1 hypothetical protein AWC03_07980 [Mycobacterium europaeum]CQD04542.1 deazaflavin-dependent nitroreductase family protein [Mycobacterium europaeum]
MAGCARLLWFPAALVTTIGRGSGKPRTTPTLELSVGEGMILPASFGAPHQEPNLVSQPP